MVKKQIMFGCCGGMYHYFAGVGTVIQRELQNHQGDLSFAGISGGCFIAMLLSMGIDITVAFDQVNLPLLEDVKKHKTGALFRYNNYAKKRIMEFLPIDAYQRVNRKLRISTTKIPSMKNEIIDEWQNNEDLIDGIMCSSYIPFFGNGLWKKYRGKKYVDGGVSDYYGDNFDLDPNEEIETYKIYTTKWRTPKAHWFWCWSCDKWAKELYDYGVQDALANLEEIRAFLGIEEPCNVNNFSRLFEIDI